MSEKYHRNMRNNHNHNHNYNHDHNHNTNINTNYDSDNNIIVNDNYNRNNKDSYKDDIIKYYHITTMNDSLLASNHKSPMITNFSHWW